MKHKSIKNTIAVFVNKTDKLFESAVDYPQLTGMLVMGVLLSPLCLFWVLTAFFEATIDIEKALVFMYSIIFVAVSLWLIPYRYFKKILAIERKKIWFYRECEKNRVNDLTDRYQKEKAILIAQRSGLAFKNIDILYAEAKEAVMTDEQDRIIAEFKELLDAEIAQKQLLTRFVHYIGRNKRVAILENTQLEYRQKAEEMRDSAYGAVRASQQKEINSGVIGGIASGLLGGVAGIAAYIDTENRNAQIRSINQRNINSMAHGILDVMNTAYEYECEADRLQHLIDDAKIKLVSDIPDDQVFSYLSISTKKVEISKTGTFGIAVEVKVNETQIPLMIGKANGVIDGTIEAEMYQDNKCVGSALMVLPTFGVKDKATIGGIAIANANTTEPYKIKFKPYCLWLMEE